MRQPGEWIHGKYQVQRVLGAGGMGVVYATKRRNESWAAVKVLQPRFAHDKSIRARFLEEGYLANRVGHPAVVTILEDDIDEEGNFYIVMELLDGVDLGQFVGPPRKPVTIAETLNIVDQLLAALTQAHQKGIVHRDIKPANVMILRDGRVKLLDFGIAKALGGPDGVVVDIDDEEEATLGTDRYMSPEQGKGFMDEIDARSDLWSVGALMMALLADHDDSAVPLWDQSYEDRAWSFARLGQDVPPHVVQIISLALQPQKNKRWVSAAAMKEAVQAAHLDLYGPLTPQPLAALAAAELGSSDAVAPAAHHHAQPAVEPTVVDATVASRPSHPPVTPRPSALQPSSEEESETPLPPVIGERGSSFRGWKSVGWGILLFALGVGVTLILTHTEPTSRAERSHVGEGDNGPEVALPLSAKKDLAAEKDRAAKKDQVGASSPKDAEATASPDDEPVVAKPPSDGVAIVPSASKPKPSPTPARTQGTAAPANPSTRPHASPAASPSTAKDQPKGASAPPRCNGLDGIFNVEHCE